MKNAFKPEALASFEKMLTADPKGENAFTKGAIVLMDAGEEAKADSIMERAYQIDPFDWQNTVEFGRACIRNGNQTLAAKWFERTVKAKPKEERMWNEIALAFADGGKPARTSF
jgi:Flp pilus assembly protein TadD